MSAVFAGAEWQLVRLSGSALLRGSRIALRADSSDFFGTTGCNVYSASYNADEGNLVVSGIDRRTRDCATPPGVLEQEDQYLSALRNAAVYRIEGDTLHLQDAAGQDVLIFERRSPFPMNPADLVGTRWRLQRLGQQSLLPGSRITSFWESSTTMRGFASCRGYTASYEAEGDAIRFSSISMDEPDCARNALLEQEGEYTTLLSEAEHYRLSPAGLEISSTRGDTLRFVPLR